MGNIKQTEHGALDILGQLPNLQIYTQIALIYALPPSHSQSQIASKLRAGLDQLSTSFPWIASRVTTAPSNDFVLAPLEPAPRLVIKDLTSDSIPSLDQMRNANFPMTMLDESLIAPIPTIPALAAQESEAGKGTPVFVVQATFVSGGLFLTFLAEHRTMDGTGQGQVLHLLSKACRGEKFTEEELVAGNMDRQGLVPLLDPADKSGRDLDNQIKEEKSEEVHDGAQATSTTPTSTWANFSFSAASQKALKELANQTLPPPPDAKFFISTDDALTAYIWQSITRAREKRLLTTSSKDVRFARAVDVRHIFEVPQAYPGMIQNMTYHNFPLTTLTSAPLGVIASDLRHAIDPQTTTLKEDTRALATAIAGASDRSKISLAASLDLSQDLMLSSWAKLQCYKLDFGLGLGNPVAVRRPRFNPFESLGYLLPRSGNGEVVLAICLRNEDLEALKADEVWRKYATYIG